MNKDKIDAFLDGLTELTLKHKIAISALGDGPFLFHPFYTDKGDCYRATKEGTTLVWTGDTIKPRTELKVIKKKSSKKASRVVEINPEAVNFGE